MRFSVPFTRALLVSVTAVSLACCGGGGDDEDLGPPEDADAAGNYQGTMLLGGTSRNFLVAVAPDGTFVGGIGASANGNSRTIIGTGMPDGNSFTATGTAYAPTTAPFPTGNPSIAALSVTNGIIVEHQQISGAYSAGGESGTFTLNYRSDLTNRGASLSRLAGTYNLLQSGPSVINAVITITAAGAITYGTTPAGCMGNGGVVIQDASINVYNFIINLGACGNVPAFTAGGLLVLDDAAAGGTNNMVVMFGTNNTRSLVWGFTGTK